MREPYEHISETAAGEFRFNDGWKEGLLTHSNRCVADRVVNLETRHDGVVTVGVGRGDTTVSASRRRCGDWENEPSTDSSLGKAIVEHLRYADAARSPTASGRQVVADGDCIPLPPADPAASEKQKERREEIARLVARRFATTNLRSTATSAAARGPVMPLVFWQLMLLETAVSLLRLDASLQEHE
jgi:hypothetical protein